MVILTDKLLCIGSKDAVKHVLNLTWLQLGDTVLDSDQTELTFIYDDQEKKIGGKIRTETLQERLELEKALKTAIEGSRVLRLPMRPSHKTMSVYMKTDASDETLLIKLIESVTKLDEFLWLRHNANSILKQGGYQVDNQGLLDRCVRPCFLLSRRPDVPEYADSRFCDSIGFLETDLFAWVESLEVQKLFPLADAVRKLAQYYGRTRSTFKQLGYTLASQPPNTLTLASHVASPRIIEAHVLQALLTGPKEGHGLAHVTKKHGIYWKQNPSHPGVEFATDSISALVATRATCAACLVKFTYMDEKQKTKSHLVLASKAVYGKTLRETLQTSPEDLNLLEMESFSEIFIISLLTCPQDWKSDNLVVVKQDGKASIVGIDNDHSFADPVVIFGAEGKHTINVKNILFCLPQCDNMIHPATRQKLLDMDPLLVLVKWVQALTKQNNLYQSLLEEKFLSILDLKQLNLPIRLRPGTLLEAYRVLTEIQHILRENEHVTLNFLFQSVYPVLFEFYAYFNRQREPDTNLETHFNQTIWSMPPFEAHPELMDTLVRIRGQDVFIRDAIKDCNHMAFDLFKGDRMPIEELEMLLRDADWSSSSVEAQNTMITIMKKLNFMNLAVIGSSEITGGDLASFADSSSGLVQIQLVRCHKMTKEALSHNVFRSRGIAIYVSGCSILPQEVTELSQQGFHISVQAESDGTSPHEPRGSMALEAPLLFQALESIRSGRYQEAYDYLTQSGATAIHVLAKYKARVMQNISIPDLMRSKHEGLLSLLVRTFGWNVNEPSMTGQRPWHLVTQLGDVAWAKFVVSTCPGLAINCQNADLESCLHLAVKEGDVPMLTYLLEDLGCDPSICDAKTRTPLTLTMRLSSISVDIKTAMAKLLIDNSKDINGWRDTMRNSFLHIALRHRLLTVAARLITSGIDVNAENINGETPLHIACSNRCRDIAANGFFRNMVPVLLDAKANPLAKTKAGRTAMHYAIKGGSRTIISSLATAHPQLLTIPDAQGLSPLHCAIEYSSSANINSLREMMEPSYQLDWNCKSALGVSPLILAAQKSNWLAIELLCAREEVEVDFLDSAQNTALFYAVSRSCLPAVQILLQKRGSNPNKGGGVISPMWRAVLVLYKDIMQTRDSSPGPSARLSSTSTMPLSGTNSNHAFSLPILGAIGTTDAAIGPSSLSPRLGGPAPSSSSSSSATVSDPNSPQPESMTSSAFSSALMGAQASQTQVGLSPVVANAVFLDAYSNSTADRYSPSPALAGETPISFASGPEYTGGVLLPPEVRNGIRHEIAASLFHYGGDMESPNLTGSYLIHEIATRSLKDGSGLTGLAEFEFVHSNAPHAIHKFNKNNECFLHLLAKLIPAAAPEPLLCTIKRLWKRYSAVVPGLNAAFYEKETTEGLSLIHLLIQSSNDVLLQDLASGPDPLLPKLKFSFEGSKTIKKHPILCALAIGNLAVCSILFEHFNFSLRTAEWKQLFTAAMKVGCLDMAKNAQLRCQPHKA
jgi:ankyrin repeat protein